MTPRKMTPAEALEVFRDCRAVERADMLTTTFYDKWGTFDNAMLKAIIALEAAIAKLAALEAKPVEPAQSMIPEPVCAKCGHTKGDHPYRHPFQPTMLSMAVEPAQPVPSDEEIVKAIATVKALGYGSTAFALAAIAKRAGVQVPPWGEITRDVGGVLGVTP